MKKMIKKLLSLAVLCCAVFAFSLPSFAASQNFYGHTISYSVSKTTSTKVMAATSCATANRVYAQATVTYNSNGVQTKTASNSSIAAVTAVADVSGYIVSYYGYHEASVNYQGSAQTFTTFSY